MRFSARPLPFACGRCCWAVPQAGSATRASVDKMMLAARPRHRLFLFDDFPAVVDFGVAFGRADVHREGAAGGRPATGLRLGPAVEPGLDPVDERVVAGLDRAQLPNYVCAFTLLQWAEVKGLWIRGLGATVGGRADEL